MAIVANLVCDHVRETMAAPVPVAEEVLAQVLDARYQQAQPFDEEYSDEVQQALRCLTKEQRMLLLLEAAGYSAAEIGERTGRTTNAVYAASHRARRAFVRSMNGLSGIAVAAVIRSATRAHHLSARAAGMTHWTATGSHIHVVHLTARVIAG